MLKQRVITALILAAGLLGALFYLPFNYFLALICGVYLIGAWEWGRMVTASTSFDKEFLLLAAMALAGILVFAHYHGVLSNNVWPSSSWPSFDYQQPITLALYAAVPWWLYAGISLVFYQKHGKLFSTAKVTQYLTGILILLPMFISILGLRLISDDGSFSTRGALFILYAIAIVAGADIGAYASGKTFGKNKLAPKISPGKTWEGVIGGILGAQLVAYVGAFYLLNIPVTNVLAFSVFILVLTCASVVGDLFISLQKRQKGIKDSSNLLPGHGGALDRLDSLAAALPLFYIGISWMGYH